MKNRILFLDFKFEYLNPIISTFKKLFVIKNFKVDYLLLLKMSQCPNLKLLNI